MHQDHGHSDIMKTLSEIKSSEAEAEKMIAEAKSTADQIMRKAKDAVMKTKSETEEAIVQRKNELLRKGMKDIESELHSILESASKDAEKIKAKKLAKSAISEAFNIFSI